MATLNIDDGIGLPSGLHDASPASNANFFSVPADMLQGGDSVGDFVPESSFPEGGLVAIVAPEPFTTFGTKWGSPTFGTTGGTVTWSIVGAGFSNATGQPFFTGQTVTLASFLSFDFTAILTNAFASWSAVANINFVQVADGGGNLGTGSTAMIRISGGSIDGPGGIGGRAFYPGSSPTAGDIVFDSSNSFDPNLFLAVATHEIGHALGLEHSNVNGSIMEASIDFGVVSPKADDIAGIQAIYGPPGATQSFVSINDVIITEGNSGTKIATFTVTRSGGTSPFSVNYVTANNSALAGSDYVATSGTVSFGNGVNTQTISVTINGDTAIESNETFFVNLSGATNGVTITDNQGVGTISNDDPQSAGLSAQKIQNDYLGIVRSALSLADATAVANAINAGTTTETAYINNLLSQVKNTTIPAVAVEGSMYSAVGTSAEVTLLTTQFLPAQVANAIKYGFNPQVYASEALGLVFAFGDENGGKAFATNFGPSKSTMPNTAAGDAAFAAAAASAIFGSSATVNTPIAIQTWVSNWKAFFTANGVVGIPNATADQIDLAARGAAWGDAVGVALANELGVLPGQVTNFLKNAAQGTAVYSASLSSQPIAAPFQGSPTAPDAGVQLVGIGAELDHVQLG